MNCFETQDRFSSYYDDMLPCDEALSFEKHLSLCQKCKKDWELFKTAVLALSSLKDENVPRGLLTKVNKRIDRLHDYPWYRKLLSGGIWDTLPQAMTISLLIFTGVIVIYLFNTIGNYSRSFRQDPFRLASLGPNKATAGKNGRAGIGAGMLERVSDPVEVVPCKIESSSVRGRIEKLVLLSNGELVRLKDESGEGENILIKVPFKSYASFREALRRAIDEERIKREKLFRGLAEKRRPTPQENLFTSAEEGNSGRYGTVLTPDRGTEKPRYENPDIKLIKVVFGR